MNYKAIQRTTVYQQITWPRRNDQIPRNKLLKWALKDI